MVVVGVVVVVVVVLIFSLKYQIMKSLKHGFILIILSCPCAEYSTNFTNRHNENKMVVLIRCTIRDLVTMIKLMAIKHNHMLYRLRVHIIPSYINTNV